MILREIHIDNFGRFHDFHLTGLGEGVNPVTGGNEFGKTTLLEFLRRLFWGFAVRKNSGRNPYPALEGSGLYGGRVEVTLASGEALTIARQGPGDGELRLTRADGSEAGGEAELAALLNVSENFYTNVYAVTIDELNRLAFLGDEDIRARLYGAGIAMGELSLPRLGSDLDRRADELFLPRGRKHRLHALQQEYDKLAGELDAANRSLPDYEALQSRAAEQRKTLEERRGGQRDAAARLDRVERMIRALPVREKLRRLEVELTATPPLPPALPGAEVELTRLRKELEKSRTRLELLTAREESFRRQAEELDPAKDSPLLDAEPALAALEAKQEWMRRQNDELRRRRELDSALTDRCAELERQLTPFSGTPVPPPPGEPLLDRWRDPARRPLPAKESAPNFAAAGVFAVGAATAVAAAIAAGSAAGALTGWAVGAGVLLSVLFGAWLHHRNRTRRLDAAFETFLREAGLRPECPSGAVETVFTRLAELAGLRNELELHREEIRRIEEELKSFRRDYLQLPGATGEPESGLLRLRHELETEKVRRSRQTLLAEQRARLAPELEEARQVAKRSEEALAGFFARCGVADEAEFRTMTERRTRRTALEQAASAERKALTLLLGENPPAGEAEVDAETLNAEREALAARSAELTEEISSLERSVGAAEQEAARLLAAADPAQLANRLEGCRNTMKENARDYLVWRECRRLLDRSIARYEREKQPEVIRRAAELFGHFTRGRYSRVHKSLATGELLMTDSLTGLQKRVAELSRGTLEELMVAMRLALIEYSERESEPLPIVFDDICVNFDPARRCAVLAELEQFAKNRQILFLAHPLPGEPDPAGTDAPQH